MNGTIIDDGVLDKYFRLKYPPVKQLRERILYNNLYITQCEKEDIYYSGIDYGYIRRDKFIKSYMYYLTTDYNGIKYIIEDIYNIQDKLDDQYNILRETLLNTGTEQIVHVCGNISTNKSLKTLAVHTKKILNDINNIGSIIDKITELETGRDKLITIFKIVHEYNLNEIWKESYTNNVDNVSKLYASIVMNTRYDQSNIDILVSSVVLFTDRIVFDEIQDSSYFETLKLLNVSKGSDKLTIYYNRFSKYFRFIERVKRNL